MDLSIFYRIFYKPSSVFKQFVEKRRYEPIILALLVSCFLNIYAYAGDFDTILRQPILLLLAFFQTSIGLFAFPLTIAIYVFLIGRLFKTNITLISVISISLLCQIPGYIETLLILFGYSSISIGSVFFGFIEETYPFLFGMLLSLTPFYIWIFILWAMAINQIFLKLEYWKKRMIFGSVVALNMILSGLLNICLRYFMSLIS